VSPEIFIFTHFFVAICKFNINGNVLIQAIPSYSARRTLFEHYVKNRAEEERKEKRAAQKAAIEGFKQLLDEASEVNVASIWISFVLISVLVSSLSTFNLWNY
jgi:hypothetical protein